MVAQSGDFISYPLGNGIGFGYILATCNSGNKEEKELYSKWYATKFGITRKDVVIQQVQPNICKGFINPDNKGVTVIPQSASDSLLPTELDSLIDLALDTHDYAWTKELKKKRDDLQYAKG